MTRIPLAIGYEVTGAEEVQHHLLAIGDRAKDARPAFRVLAEQFRRSEELLFEAEGGGEWPPLKLATIEQKASRGLRPEILQATGALKDSLTRREAEGATEYMTPEELVFGTALTTESGAPYPFFHQEGTRYMPSRPPLIVYAAQLVISTKVIQSWMMAENRLSFGVGEWSMTSLDPFGLAGQA